MASNRLAVDEELRQARGLYLPSLDIAAGIGKERTNDPGTRAAGEGTVTLTREEYSATLIQRLFDGFETDSRVARQKGRVESAARRVFETSEFLALDVTGAYLEVIRQRELVRLAENNVKIHVVMVESLTERLIRGVGTTADVAQAEARLARTQATLTQRLNDLRDTEALYNRIVGAYPEELLRPELAEGAMPGDLDAALTLTEENNPTARIFEADIKASEAEVDLAEAEFFPFITLEAGTTYFDDRDGVEGYDHDQTLMVRMRWNLFRGGIDRANRREALQRVSEDKSRRLSALIDAGEEMRRSWNRVEASHRRVEELGRSVQFNIETRDAYVAQFEVARRTLLDVLDAENELFQSRGQLVSVEIDELRASYRVLAVAGVLLKSLGIAAPAEADIGSRPFLQDIWRFD